MHGQLYELAYAPLGITASWLTLVELRLNLFSEVTVNWYLRQSSPPAAAGVSITERELVVYTSEVSPVVARSVDVMINITSSPSRAKPCCQDSHTPRPLAGNVRVRLEGGEGSPEKFISSNFLLRQTFCLSSSWLDWAVC